MTTFFTIPPNQSEVNEIRLITFQLNQAEPLFHSDFNLTWIISTKSFWIHLGLEHCSRLLLTCFVLTLTWLGTFQMNQFDFISSWLWLDLDHSSRILEHFKSWLWFDLDDSDWINLICAIPTLTHSDHSGWSRLSLFHPDSNWINLNINGLDSDTT